jgi:uncharacterized membrane protein
VNQELLDWVNLFARWLHLAAGIMWLGQTWLFQWMERALEPATDGDPNAMGELWMVHGGGFYFMRKLKWPKVMPHTLHWFKWEAAFTWMSGMVLLAVIYWTGAPLLEFGSDMSRGAAIGVSVGTLILGWVGYAAIFRSPLGKDETVGGIAGFLATLAVAYGLSNYLSDRAMYLHIGAMYGTIMVANVWMVIIPSQKKIMAIVEKGGKPDLALSSRGKRASKHNTYMAIPVLFLMLSSHFPMTFGSPARLPLLAVLLLAGYAGAKAMRDYL